MVKKVVKDEFSSLDIYNLYRSVREILHPSISKRNISNYRIVLNEDVLPVRVFYPKKVSSLDKVLFFIHGDGIVSECSGIYGDICSDLAVKLNRIIIAIDYDQIIRDKYPKVYNRIYETVKFIYNELVRCNIKERNIAICGDSTGGHVALYVERLGLKKKELHFNKCVLFYPIVSLEYFGKTKYNSIIENSKHDLLLIEHLKNYYKKIIDKDRLDDVMLYPLRMRSFKSFSKLLIFTSNSDPLKDEAFELYSKGKDNNKWFYHEFTFGTHGFLKSRDEELKKDMYNRLLDFLDAQ